MLVPIFHLALMLALLWHQRHSEYRHSPWKLAAAWYAAGAVVIVAESYAITRLSFSILALQGVLLEILFAVAAGFAFRYAKKRRRGLLAPFLVFAAYGLIATIIAGFLLAQGNVVQGLSK
jgi:membrane protease YdiL (CAAX protease family)